MYCYSCIESKNFQFLTNPSSVLGLKALENYWGPKKPLFLLHIHVVFVSFIDGLFSLHTLTFLTLLLGKWVQFHQFQHARTEMTHHTPLKTVLRQETTLCTTEYSSSWQQELCSCLSSDCQTWRPSLPTCGGSSLKLSLICRTLLNTSTIYNFKY